MLKTFDTLSSEERDKVHIGVNVMISELIDYFQREGTPLAMAMIVSTVFAEMKQADMEGRKMNLAQAETRIGELWDRYIAPLGLPNQAGGHA